MNSVRKLRSPGNPFDPANYGISLDHVRAVQSAVARDDRTLSRTRSAPAFDRVCDRLVRLAAVRDAVFDAASPHFNPACHDITLDHARAVAAAMAEEAETVRTGLQQGRIRPVETFELLVEVHDFVCSMIENAMEGCP
ncbi:hypothetical protein Q8W71_30935 [Methylobacterium sp. NEAU 140]|uniref:hypothetical protein n=1 Tax=Methylobacterium sp. NEAU 140 TaxID=3064945 RepID=UPI002733B7AD|nr:hypothetical protein [Methylobacterium sp. NEAU 140]MDP4027008.1 hypothetical protein [Methylobacterium sp. NEAU 140]